MELSTFATHSHQRQGAWREADKLTAESFFRFEDNLIVQK